MHNRHNIHFNVYICKKLKIRSIKTSQKGLKVAKADEMADRPDGW